LKEPEGPRQYPRPDSHQQYEERANARGKVHMTALLRSSDGTAGQEVALPPRRFRTKAPSRETLLFYYVRPPNTSRPACGLDADRLATARAPDRSLLRLSIHAQGRPKGDRLRRPSSASKSAHEHNLMR